MSASKNFFRVANLHNLFWDNGSYKYPNTYPRLINGENPNKTPVMTSPTSGWVILEGDWNYCQFREDLFFLKKSYVISHTRNKWMYILIKDHICTLFKNRDDVIAYGTMINTDLENLEDQDFQYTFPVFNNYNRRILIPLNKEKFNWRKHASPENKRISKKFEDYHPTTDQDFSDFVAQLQVNKDFLTQNGKLRWEEVIKDNDYLVLLGLMGSSKQKVTGWKNELATRINAFLQDLTANEDIVLGTISNDVAVGATKLNGRIGISYSHDNPLFRIIHSELEIDIDLSGLTDIELINLDNPAPNEKYSLDHFNLWLNYDVNKVSRKFNRPADNDNVFIHKLVKRIRLPFLNEYSTRAIYKTGGQHYPFVWRPLNDSKILWPQKIFIKPKKPLVRKTGSTPREVYRSVYLYWYFDWNLMFVWGGQQERQAKPKYYSGRTWVDNVTYFKDDNVLRSVSGNQYVEAEVGGLYPVLKEEYTSEFPWSRGGARNAGEPINLGWLLGQFSMYIEDQDGQFEPNFPFIVKSGVVGDKKLKRLKGFRDTVADLIQLEDLYTNAREVSDHRYTLDIFTPLSRRHREENKEEDFMIGEKLLFTTWGMAPYLLFQPACFRKGQDERMVAATAIFHLGFGYLTTTVGYSYYNWEDIDDYYKPQLFGKWITQASWHYPYSVFDQGSYFTQHAKEWYKQAERGYIPLTPYKRFYDNPTNYKELKKHIVNNTKAYFEFEEVDFKTNEIKELRVNDIFYSQGEWFWFDAGGGLGGKLPKSDAIDCIFSYNSLINDKLSNGDVVAYLNPKDKKIYLAKVHLWENKMSLPDGQTISEYGKLNNDSSTVDYVTTRYFRFTPLGTDFTSRDIQFFNSIDELISVLKGNRFMKQTQPNNLKQLQDQGRGYLFNLKGTPFFCTLDRNGKVSLIFKNKRTYQEQEHIPN